MFCSLEQFAGGEVADEAAVCGEEFVGGEVLKADPANLLVDLVVDRAGELVDSKELQVDGAAVAVVVADAGDGLANGGLDAEFFRKFAGEGLLRTFTGFDFSAGKLPQQGHGLIGAPLPDEDLSLAHDEGGRDKTQSGAVGPGGGVWLFWRHPFSVNATKELAHRAHGSVLAG